MSSKCPFLEGCPFYEFARLKTTQRALVSTYCTGTYETCARYKLRSSGQPVPKELWPDGEMAIRVSKQSDTYMTA